MFQTPKLGLFVVLGAIFWLSAALAVRLIGAAAFSPGNVFLVVMYSIACPLLWLAIFIASRISGVPLNQMFKPTVLMTMVAMFLDGIAISWATGLYGTDPSVVMHGAAWILWGAAVGILIAWLLADRSDKAVS